MTGEASKHCSKCGELKQLSAFYADKRRLDGRRDECAICNGKDAKKRAENPENRERNRNRSLKHFYLNKGASPRLAALLVEKRRRERK